MNDMNTRGLITATVRNIKKMIINNSNNSSIGADIPFKFAVSGLGIIQNI